jgi:hypothetical protein
VGHVSRSGGLLHLKVSRARVFQSSIKTSEGTTWIVHLSSSWRSHEDKAEDKRVNTTGCITLFYPNFVVFVVLCPKGILIFLLGLKIRLKG